MVVATLLVAVFAHGEGGARTGAAFVGGAPSTEAEFQPLHPESQLVPYVEVLPAILSGAGVTVDLPRWRPVEWRVVHAHREVVRVWFYPLYSRPPPAV